MLLQLFNLLQFVDLLHYHFFAYSPQFNHFCYTWTELEVFVRPSDYFHFLINPFATRALQLASSPFVPRLLLLAVCFTTFLTCLQGLGKQHKHSRQQAAGGGEAGRTWMNNSQMQTHKKGTNSTLVLRVGSNLQRLALPTLNASNYIFY